MLNYEDGFSTTFWQDFSIADAFGTAAIEDTFNRAFSEWRNDYRYLTDLVIVLNHKIWQHYEAGHDEYAIKYDLYWRIADEYARHNLKGEELDYFFAQTD